MWYSTRQTRVCLNRNNSASGFTLLEVLIAIVVFAVGLLGLIHLQVNSLKLQHDSEIRATATWLTADMADRMRANRTQALLGLNSAYHNPTREVGGTPACLGLSNQGIANEDSCTTEQMALFDFYEWQNLIQGSPATDWHPASRAVLASGSGIVCIDSTPDDGTPDNPACDGVVSVSERPVFAIKVWWLERKDAGEAYQRHTMSLTP